MTLGEGIHFKTWGFRRLLATASIMLLVITTLVFAPAPTSDAFPGGVAWGSTEHRYRIPIDISSVTGGDELVAVTDADFTAALAEAGVSGATFDPATLRVHEVDAGGALINTDVSFQFDADATFDASSAATGELVIALSGTTTAAVDRHYVAYFEESGVTTTPPVVPPVVTVNATAFDEGLAVAHISTPGTDWFYDLAGGGFTSVVDAQGNDWVNYHAGGGSSGEYRGIPNLVFNAGHFHPGATTATTTIDATGPVRASFSSTTTDGWAMSWEIFATHARATIDAAPSNYWFLYEGTPGGSFESTDILVLADGTVTTADATIDGDIVGEEWVAFGDPAVNRSIFIANHLDDTSHDHYEELDEEMTVLGFGRENLSRRLSGVDRSFSVGLVEATDHASIASVSRAAMAPPTVVVGLAENDGSLSGPGFESDDFNAAGLSSEWTFIDPVGDSSYVLDGAGSGQATVAISVPSGSSHDPWGVNDAARLMQPVNDVNFELEVGFDSLPSQQFQANGVLVEQDASNYIRFDIYHDGTDLRAFGGQTVAGFGSANFDVVVPAGTRFLRLGRVADLWSADYSADQQTWTPAGSFTLVMDANHAGVFASNAGPNPAYTAVVDYVFETATPVAPEDGIFTYPVNVTTVGDGVVTSAPDQISYADGSVVQLTATPDTGSTFVGWTGDATSTNPVLDVVVSGGPVSVTATFDTPNSYPVNVTVVGDGTVTKAPDQATYADGAIVQLTATADSGSSFLGWTGDVTSSDLVVDVTVSGSAPDVTANFSSIGVGSSFASDDFHTPGLGSQWTFVDPVGDASYSVVGAGTGDATLSISVPANSEHNPWSPNESARLMAPIVDQDFELEVGFESLPSQQYQMNGLLVEQDVDNWLRFDLYHDGSDLHVFAAESVAGSPGSTLDQVVPADTRYLRLSRVGDLWSGSYSSDGVTWTAAGSFSLVLAATSAGVFAGNAGSDPAYTAVVDYIFDTAAPIIPEDANFAVDPTVVGNGSVTKSPDQATNTVGSIVQLTAIPDNGATFTGWTGDVTSTDPVIDLTITGPVSVTATFTGITTGFTSDDFDTLDLGAQWAFVDPIGDASLTLSGTGTGQATAAIALPAGTAHNPWNVNNAARIMQPILDVDFTLDAGFESQPTQQFQINGLLVEQDVSTWVRFDAYYDGFDLRVFGASTSADVSTEHFDIVVPLGTTFLRLARSADTWVGSYSSDGVTWTEAGSFEFVMSPSNAGVFAGNAGSNTPAYTAVIDYVFDAVAPINPEDASTDIPHPVDITIVGDGAVSKTPDQPLYLDGSVVTLSATPNAGMIFAGWTGATTSTDPVIDVTVIGGPVAVTATFVADSTPPTGFTSDDFDNNALGSQWTFVDPVGDSSFALSGAGSGQATVSISVPAGSDHDPWNSNDAARLMQPISDSDFELEVGLVSVPDQRYEMNGIMVEQDADNWIRFDSYHNGNDLRIFAATTENGNSSSEFNSSVSQAITDLRLNRSGNLWTAEYSHDGGVSWTLAGSFFHTLAPTNAGVFAANAKPYPAFTAVFDYVFDTAAPIVPEDGTAAYQVNIATVGNGTAAKSPDAASYADGTIVQLTASPDAGESFVGWTGDVNSTNPVVDVTIAGAPISVTATFTETAPPANQFVSDDFDDTTLGSQWTFVDPVGDASYVLTGSGTGEAAVSISVPAGTEHDVWRTNESARLMQPIDDSDFALSVGLGSVPTEKYQMNGILVEQDIDNWIRFDAYHDGGDLRVFGARTLDGSSNAAFSTIAPADTSFLRLERTGDTWSGYYSSDGNTWSAAGSFTFALAPTSAGIFAGNAGPDPAYTAVFDYAVEMATPVVPEDGAFHPIDINVNGNGSVTKSPDAATHANGSTVQVTATPNAGDVFLGWTGDITSSDLVLDLTVAGQPIDLIANFSSDSHAVDVGVSGNGSVSKTPDLPTYPNGSVVQLTATPDTGESFVGWTGDYTSTDLVLDVTVAGGPVAVAATFTDSSAPPTGFVSDDFDDALLGSQWTFVDPVGDSSYALAGAGSGQATVSISVPAGGDHNAWDDNESARLMQLIDDSDFEIEVGFDASPTAEFQMNGIIVEQDADNWVRFDAYHDGGQVRVFGASTSGGSSDGEFNVIAPNDTKFLRLARSGNVWTGHYSSNGTAWTLAGSFSFSIATTSAGVFAGNAGPNPAYTAVVDYFFETSAPVVPEDGDTYPVAITVIGDGSATKSPDQATYIDGAVVQLTATPDPGETFIGWTGDVTSTNPVIDVTIAGAAISVTAEFSHAAPSHPVNVTLVGDGTITKSPDQATYTDGTVVQLTAVAEPGETFLGWSGDVTSANAVIDVTVNGAPVSLIATFTDTPPASGIDVWYGSTQNFGENGETQRWVNVTGSAFDPDGIASLTYRLNGGPLQGLSVGPDPRRIYGDGDFNVEIDKADLLVGANTVLIIMNDANSDTTEETVTVNWNPVTPSLPYSIDWSTALNPHDGAQPVDGLWGLDNGSLRILETGYDRLVTVGDLSWTDYEVEVPVTINSLGPGSGTSQSGDPLVGFGLRWQGHSLTNDQPNEGWFPTGAFAWYRPSSGGSKRLELIGNDGSPTDRHTIGELAFGTTYIFKAQAETEANGTRYRFKVWEQGQAEPGWLTEILEPNGPASGSLLMIAHHYDVSFGNVTVSPIS